MALHSVDVRLEDSKGSECVDLVISITREDFEMLKQEAIRKHKPDLALAVLNAAYRFFSTWSEERAETLAKRLLSLGTKSPSSPSRDA